MKKYLLVAFLGCALFAEAQELNLNVKVNAPNLKTVDPKVIQDLEANISEYLNNTKWTDHEYEDHERIEGSINITISEELSPTSFQADFLIQALRPVYNSNYKTQLLNWVDSDVPFEYIERQAIRRSDNNYFDNLSSVLTFYAMIILGLDYDSFSPQGGEPYLNVAQNILNTIPESVKSFDKGWKNSVTDNNRFKMVENYLNPRVKPFRQAMYEYHRLSLDAMANDADKSKAIMTSAITSIFQVDKDLPNSLVVNMFSDAKRLEIVEIYKDASRGEQAKVYNIMVELDPARASDYNDIR